MRPQARQGGTVVSLHGAFHGAPTALFSATPQESKQAPFAPLVGGFVSVEPTIDALRRLSTSTRGSDHRADPGRERRHVLGDELLVAARELCDEKGATPDLDEIQTGLGRTARSGYERSGVIPTAVHREGARWRPADRRLITGERHATPSRPGITAPPSPGDRSSARPRTRRSTWSSTRFCWSAYASSASSCARGLPASATSRRFAVGA